MKLFSNRSNELVRLIESGQKAGTNEAKREFLSQLWQFFGPQIKRSATADLHQTVLAELSVLIQKLPADPTYFLQHSDAVVAELIVACGWKQLLHNGFSVIEVAELGVAYQAQIKGWLTDLKTGPPTRNQRLLTYLTDRADWDKLAYRTLRAILAYLKNRPTSVFRLTHAGRVELDKTIGQSYLFDQLALYVYLFKEKNEVKFLTEACLYVERWIISEIQSIPSVTVPELDQQASDMVGDIRLDFLRKYDTHRLPHNPLYVDARFTTYLAGYTKTNHAIGKLLARYGRHIDPNEGEVENTVDASALSREQSETFRHDQNRLLAKYIRKLKPDCQTLLITKFGDGFASPRPMKEVADLLKRELGPLYDQFERCMKSLKKLIADNGRRGPGLSPTAP